MISLRFSCCPDLKVLISLLISVLMILMYFSYFFDFDAFLTGGFLVACDLVYTCIKGMLCWFYIEAFSVLIRTVVHCIAGNLDFLVKTMMCFRRIVLHCMTYGRLSQTVLWHFVLLFEYIVGDVDGRILNTFSM